MRILRHSLASTVHGSQERLRGSVPFIRCALEVLSRLRRLTGKKQLAAVFIVARLRAASEYEKDKAQR